MTQPYTEQAMNNTQPNTNPANTPFDMARFAAELADDPTMEPAYRELRENTRIVSALVLARARKGMSQADVAKAIGVDPSTISRFEAKSDEKLELGMLMKYIGAIGLHASIVFDDGSQSDAACIKSCVFAIHDLLGRLTDIARKQPDDASLCDGIAKFQAEVLINFLAKYRDSADLPRVFNFFQNVSGVHPVPVTATNERESGRDSTPSSERMASRVS